METIELTKQEVQQVISALALLPYKDVAALIQFFTTKPLVKKEEVKEEEKKAE